MAVYTFDTKFANRSAYTLRLVVTTGTSDIAGNFTPVSWTLNVIENPEWGSWRFDTDSTWSVNVGGITASGLWNFNFRVGPNTKFLGSGSGNITHAADGTMTFNVSASANGHNPLGVANLSGTVGLDRIPRGPRMRHAGVWRNTVMYVRHAGVWRTAVLYVRSGGVWRVAGG